MDGCKVFNRPNTQRNTRNALAFAALVTIILFIQGSREIAAFIALNLAWIIPVVFIVPEKPISMAVFDDRIEVKFRRRSELVFRKEDKVEIEVDGASFSNFVVSGSQGHVIIDDKFENWNDLVREIERLWPEFESILSQIANFSSNAVRRQTPKK